MAKIDSLQRALDNHALMYGKAKVEMMSMRSTHPLTWWLRPRYWSLSNERVNQHRKVIRARILLVTAEKEKANG